MSWWGSKFKAKMKKTCYSIPDNKKYSQAEKKMTKGFLVITDLDNTLFQSHENDPSGLLPMSTDRDGKNHGYSRKDQSDLLSGLLSIGRIIPVTSRSHSQVERISGWKTGSDFDVAISDLGANLLYRKNTENPDKDEWIAVKAWSDLYKNDIEKHNIKMIKDYKLIMGEIIPEAGLSSEVRVDLIALGKAAVPLYFSMSVDPGSSVGIDYIMDRFATPISTLSGIYSLEKKGNTICFLPKFISKNKAVERLLEMIRDGVKDPDLRRIVKSLNAKESTVMTVGSDIADHEFMKLGDIMVLSGKSPLAKKLADACAK